jgi:hypothetical protein
VRAWVEMIKVDSFCSVDTQETSDKGTHETDRSCAAQRIEARVVRCVKFDSQVSFMEEVKLERKRQQKVCYLYPSETYIGSELINRDEGSSMG